MKEHQQSQMLLINNQEPGEEILGHLLEAREKVQRDLPHHISGDQAKCIGNQATDLVSLLLEDEWGTGQISCQTLPSTAMLGPGLSRTGQMQR